MAKNPFLAGIGTVLMFQGDNLIGVAKTLTDTTFNYSITEEEIRGGAGNGLLGKYFHDSGLAINLTDALFDMNYMSMSLGLPLESGGLSFYESSSAGEVADAQGKITLTKVPQAVNNSLIAWYKKPADAEWNVTTITQTGDVYTIAPDGAAQNDVYCIKYFYMNDSAKQLTIKVNRVPAIVHLVIINDLFSGEPEDIGSSAKWGRLITDIPSFQFSGNQDLSLSSASAATVSLTGNALAVNTSGTCEEESVYGTMTQERYNADWRDEALTLAALNSDMDLTVGDSETAVIYAVFGGNVASSRKANSYFTFTQSSGSSSYFTVSSNGVITASAAGTGTIEVNVTGDYNVEPAFISVTVSA